MPSAHLLRPACGCGCVNGQLAVGGLTISNYMLIGDDLLSGYTGQHVVGTIYMAILWLTICDTSIISGIIYSSHY